MQTHSIHWHHLYSTYTYEDFVKHRMNSNFPDKDIISTEACQTPEEVFASDDFARFVEIVARRIDQCQYDHQELTAAIRAVVWDAWTTPQADLVYRALTDDAFCRTANEVLWKIRFQSVDGEASECLLDLFHKDPQVLGVYRGERSIWMLRKRVTSRLLTCMNFHGSDIKNVFPFVAFCYLQWSFSNDVVISFLCRRLELDQIDDDSSFEFGYETNSWSPNLVIRGFGYRGKKKFKINGFEISPVEESTPVAA